MPTLQALRPFAHREYRVLISALAISIFGSGMWAVAMVYQVIHLGGGPLELALVATAGSVGLVAFVLAGGIAADRVPQRLLIIAVEGANLTVIAAISGLAMAGWLQLWHLACGVCPVLAVVAMIAARMPDDELAHSLEPAEAERTTAAGD
jgi:MFS family permease